MSATAPQPQLTLKAILLGLVLSMVLAGANAYRRIVAMRGNPNVTRTVAMRRGPTIMRISTVRRCPMIGLIATVRRSPQRSA